MHPTIDGSSTLHVVPLRHEPAPADGTVMPVDHGSKPAVAAGDPGTAEHTDQAHAEWQEAEQAAADAPPHDYTAVSTAREKREAFETAEETIEALNAMSGDADQLKALQAQVNQLRYANQHLLLGGG